MGSIYLTWLADELRGAGLNVREYSGWQNRARSSGGYSSPAPIVVMEHHTASPASWNGQKDADYIAKGSDVAPVSNLYIDRQGLVWVIAGGATNTNGQGNSMRFSRGTVPQDSMNTYAVGIECGNDGVGEPWPQVQVDALIAAANCINRRLGNISSDIAGHAHYAPTRKIDPATAAAVQGPWKPRSINSSGTWNLDDMRAIHAQRWGGAPPTPPPLEDDMGAPAVIVTDSGTISRFFVVGGPNKSVWQCWWQPDHGTYSSWQDLGGQAKGEVFASCAGARIDLAIEGLDNQVWTQHWDGSAWSGWAPVLPIP